MAPDIRAAEPASGLPRPRYNFTEYHRAAAVAFRRRAAATPHPDMAARLLRVAAHHDRLAAIEAGEWPRKRSHALDIAAIAPLEDVVAKSRRHVAQAERNVERQRLLVARLSADSRFAALAELAEDVLTTLTRTLKLAREHLAVELAERGVSEG